jgi:Rrf2 family protein
MRISSKGRYSLEALLYMGLLPENGYASTKTIAEQIGMSDGYLEQLFIPLRKNGLARGIRGAQGGYTLGKAPEDIRVGDILRAVEGALEPVDCLNSRVCPAENACLSRRAWSDLYEEINACIDSITMKDIIDMYKTIYTDEYSI